MPVVKKSVALHPLIDKFIRKSWAMLIETGNDASYSTAINFMLFGAVFEAVKSGGWSDKTRNLVWDFIEDRKTIDEINLEEQLTNIHEYFARSSVKGG